MLLKKNYLLFLLLIFIILINKNIFAAPLCFEEEDNIENKEFTINENSSELSIKVITSFGSSCLINDIK